MKRVLIALKLKEKTVAEIILLGRGIVKGMMSNPAYPNPNPSLASVILHLDELAKAEAKCGKNPTYGSSKDYMRRNSFLELVKKDLTALALYAMRMTFDDAASLSAAGFPLKSHKEPTGKLPAPQDLHQHIADNILQGTIKLRWKRPAVASKVKVNIYEVLRSSTSDFADAVKIGNTSKTTFTDVNVGMGMYYYWVIPYNAYGSGVVSNLCIAQAMTLA